MADHAEFLVIKPLLNSTKLVDIHLTNPLTFGLVIANDIDLITTWSPNMTQYQIQPTAIYIYTCSSI